MIAREDLYVRKSYLKYVLGILAVMFGICSAAHGMAFYPIPHRKPEIDPSLAVSSLTLLAGTLAVLRARRSK